VRVGAAAAAVAVVKRTSSNSACALSRKKVRAVQTIIALFASTSKFRNIGTHFILAFDKDRYFSFWGTGSGKSFRFLVSTGTR
jgi:hypothetical protein